MKTAPSRSRLVAALVLPLVAFAQEQPYRIERPSFPLGIRSYAPQLVPPIRMTNSQRLHTLIRGGNLYLSVQDALALAIENNLNLEINRYGPLLADSALERARAGGPLRGVPSASAQVSSVNAGVGVNGTASSAGVGGGGGGGGGNGGAGGAAIQQVGSITPNLDPVLQSTTTFSHLTSPQANTVLSQTSALVDSVHNYNNVMQQGLLSGGTLSFRSFEGYTKENSPNDLLNPAVGPHMDLTFRHSLLRGRGTLLNNRGIRAALINVEGSREVFRSQLLDLVVSVLNLYWDMVSARDQLKVREHALTVAQKFVADTKMEISVGAIPAVEISRAEAEEATRKQDLSVAQVAVRQRATALKEALSHTVDPLLESAEIIPTDSIEVPENEDLPPVRDLLKTAMANRPDVAVSKLRDQTTEIGLAGTIDPLRPNLSVSAVTYNRGVAGTPQHPGANSFFDGGYGSALGQVFHRNFPNNQAAVNFSIRLNNRQAQADYGIDQLQFRQGQLRSQKDDNQILVDISSQVNALRQASSRYSTAKARRILQEQLLDAEQKRAAGIATLNILMADQRALLAAQISEMSALASYSKARISLDQVLGETLEKNHITLDEGLAGRVERESRLPDVAARVPDEEKK
jgi:outer membrane protein TolC